MVVCVGGGATVGCDVGRPETLEEGGAFDLLHHLCCGLTPFQDIQDTANAEADGYGIMCKRGTRKKKRFLVDFVGKTLRWGGGRHWQ